MGKVPLETPQPQRIGYATAMICGGAGPLLVGMLSDFLEPTLGIESLRYTMVAGILFMGWGVVHFWLSSRHFRGELI